MITLDPSGLTARHSNQPSAFIHYDKLPETQSSSPYSPYGLTKLAGEQLCQLYYKNYGLPVVSLRYFTVYGPGQRPDMAFHLFIKQILQNSPLVIYGDGQQTRDFTYIHDAVQANLLAMEHGKAGCAYNIGGNSRVKLVEVIDLLGQIIGQEPQLTFTAKQAGDPDHTWADISKAKEDLGYHPSYSLEKGLRKQVTYIQQLYGL